MKCGDTAGIPGFCGVFWRSEILRHGVTDVLGFCAELALPPATTPPHPKRGCRSPCAPACRHELTSSLDAREEDAFGDAQLHRKTRPCGFVWLELQEPSRTDRVGGQAEWRTPRLRDLGSDMLGPYSGTNYVGYGCSTFLGCATSKDRRVMFFAPKLVQGGDQTMCCSRRLCFDG